ncbi:MAG: hypothetical protein R3295_02100 [Marinobacter sp.]|nr:hypothetical protein [Marinobacter sp.]
MTATAADRLDKLKSDIETRLASIEGLREEYGELLTAGDDETADKVAAEIRDDESALAILKDRLPVLGELAEQEAVEARSIEAEQLTKEANEKQADLKARYARAAKAVEQLQKAVSEIEDNAGLNWYLVANKAAKLGGNPDRTQVEGVRQLLNSLEESKCRLIGINEAYTQRITQIFLSR